MKLLSTYAAVMLFVYIVLVTFSLFSLHNKANLGAIVFFYVLNGAYVTLIVMYELLLYKQRATRPDMLLKNMTIDVVRTINGSVIAALVFSVFSGYETIDTAYSYNFKSLLFLFTPNMVLVAIKSRELFDVAPEVFAFVSLFFILAYLMIIIMYFRHGLD